MSYQLMPYSSFVDTSSHALTYGTLSISRLVDIAPSPSAKGWKGGAKFFPSPFKVGTLEINPQRIRIISEYVTEVLAVIVDAYSSEKRSMASYNYVAFLLRREAELRGLTSFFDIPLLIPLTTVIVELKPTDRRPFQFAFAENSQDTDTELLIDNSVEPVGFANPSDEGALVIVDEINPPRSEEIYGNCNILVITTRRDKTVQIEAVHVIFARNKPLDGPKAVKSSTALNKLVQVHWTKTLICAFESFFFSKRFVL